MARRGQSSGLPPIQEAVVPGMPLVVKPLPLAPAAAVGGTPTFVQRLTPSAAAAPILPQVVTPAPKTPKPQPVYGSGAFGGRRGG